MKSIGNILHESVPVSKDEADNKIVSEWGKISELKIDGKTPGKLHHN